MQIGLIKDTLTVISCYEDSPSYFEGLQSGDQILMVDTTSTIGNISLMDKGVVSVGKRKGNNPHKVVGIRPDNNQHLGTQQLEFSLVNIELDGEGDTGGHIAVATLGTGSHFGEMGFLDNQPRSASAIAASHSDILGIGYSAMKTLLESDSMLATHVYKQLAGFLCSRLRLTTLDLGYERSRNFGHL